MCLLFFSYRTTPGYRLVVASNRDEFLSRPTAPLGFLDTEKTILAGLDVQGGGTWLGINAQLKFGAITNYREPGRTNSTAPSRGNILTTYLTADTSARQYIDFLAGHEDGYNGYNLILGDAQDLFYSSNRAIPPRLLRPGFYGLSNHLLDSPWPKVVRGKKLLRPSMVETNRVDPQQIFDLLTDNHQPPEAQLPDTGVGSEWEKLLGSIFIDGPGYGTRSSAVITVTDEGVVEFTEKSLLRSSTGNIRSELTHFTLGV